MQNSFCEEFIRFPVCKTNAGPILLKRPLLAKWGYFKPISVEIRQTMSDARCLRSRAFGVREDFFKVSLSMKTPAALPARHLLAPVASLKQSL